MLTSLNLRIATLAVLCCGLLPGETQAGPLLDWLFGRNRAQPAYAVGQPVPVGNGVYGAGYAGYPAPWTGGTAAAAPNGYIANFGNYYGSSLPTVGPAGAGYQAARPSGVAAATMPSTLSYVPNFNSYANRVPVTYYRPILTTDPNTGAQVVAMAPCTSYEYQTQRVPTFGRSALFGSTTAPAMPIAPQALPTYTLPSGGIPLAAASPSVLNPTLRGYGTYSTLQPPVSGYSAPGSYPTAPAGSVPGYAAPSGGSCGNYYSPPTSVPGLTAPADPNTYPAPGVYPPSSAPSSDPAADVPPSLPPTFPSNTSAQSTLKPQLRSIVRQPMNSASDGRRATSSPDAGTAPSMLKPIPVPKDFEQPRWSPGLLKAEDMTASHSSAGVPPAVAAGQAKTIHWASFEQAADQPPPSYSSFKPATADQLELTGPTSELRPLTAPPAQSLTPPAAAEPSSRYDTRGWKAAR